MAYIYKTDRVELLEQIKLHAGFIKGRTLDVGAGKFSRYKNLFAFDEYIKMDIKKEENPDIIGEAENIPFENNSFNSVVCTQVLGDIYKPQKALDEFYRVLRPEGILLLTENLFDSLHDEPIDYWRFTKHSLRRLAEDAGFRVKIIKSYGGYRSVVAQMKARYWIERFSLNRRWFARFFSFMFKIFGECARLNDRKDKSAANKLFVHGYILIAEK